MDFDKHDLFRNAFPGYVFLIVVLSFYVANQSLQNINEGQAAWLGLVAGIPLGFVIQSLYKMLHYLFEIRHMDKKECSLITLPSGMSLREGGHHVWFRLSKLKNDSWKERIDFLYSYIHSLGASALAIILAIVAMWNFEQDKMFLHPEIAIIWTIIAALIMFYLRERVKDNAWLSTKIYFNSTKTKLPKQEAVTPVPGLPYTKKTVWEKLNTLLSNIGFSSVIIAFAVFLIDFSPAMSVELHKINIQANEGRTFLAL